MKRLLTLCAVLLCLIPASLLAFRPADVAPLPDLDKRLANAPAQAVLPAEKQAASARLKDRIPAAKVTSDRLFSAPLFISHPQGFLTPPAGQGNLQAAGDPHGPIKAFLNEHSALFGYDSQILQTARIKRDATTAHNGLHTLQWEQHLDGITVFESILLGHITKNGELVNLTTRLLPNPAQAADAYLPNRRVLQKAPPIPAPQALVLAANELGDQLDLAQVTPLAQPSGPEQKQSFHAAPVLRQEAYAELVWLPLNEASMTLCWKVLFTSGSRNEMFYSLVDAATGEVWIRRCLTRYISNASYRVYTSDSPSPFSPGHLVPDTNQPPLVQRTLVVTNAFNTNASPNGWINDADNITMGNNVDAYLDRDANNTPDTPRTQGNPNRVFDFTLDLTQAPTNYGDASVVQLFYLCNVYHDRLYELGFTEAYGNFQMTNFGRGGFEDDSVMAESQDGSGTDNANFSTPPDGYSGRMQMYIWTGPIPNRDSSLDAEIVFHEHTHGLSWRLVGGGDALYNEQSDSMGEGWSDFYGMALLSEPADNVDGNYADSGYCSFLLSGLAPPPTVETENYYFGIRRYPYSTDLNKNPVTFKDIDPTQILPHTNAPLNPVWPFDPQWANEVHFAGEVWCVTLWEARANLIRKWGYATGNQLILQLVTDGMKLTPPYPDFLQARDAIIQADLVNTGGANYLELWAAFAKRGMGSSATSPGSATSIGVTEAFDMPGVTFKDVFSVDLFTGNGNGVIDYNECNELLIALANNSRASANNVSATLFTTTPGVVLSQASSPYPDILPGLTATNLIPFKIYTTPSFVCGAFIDFTLFISSSTETRTNRFRMSTGRVGAAVRFNNNSPVPIPGGNPSGAESPINVQGIPSGIANVTVSLHISHPIVWDLALTLIAPDGTRVILYSHDDWTGLADFGLACTPDSYRTTFDDKAALPIRAGYPPYVGSFRPRQSFTGLLGKSGSAVNGVWRLHAASTYFPFVGSIECWSLELSPTSCSPGTGDCSTDLRISSSYAPASPIVLSNLTISLAVNNTGPNAARGVIVTNVLPPQFTFLSATSSRGSCSGFSNIVSCSLGNIANGANANITILAQPTQPGSFINVATVSSLVPDVMVANNTSTLFIQVYPPRPILIPAGTTLLAENAIPPNRGIDPGETVTIGFGLRNIGALSTSNLVATLLNTNGVTAASSNRSYGVLLPGGLAATNSFTFTAVGTNGGTLTATFQLQDGTNNWGYVSFPFQLVGSYSWHNPAVIQIRDTNTAVPYPSSITVSGLGSTMINKVTVTLSNIIHNSAVDIDVLLVSPSGKSALLMSDAGYVYPLDHATLTFDDTGVSLPRWEPITSGTYAPTDYPRTDATNDDLFPEPAPAAPYGRNLSVFNGSDPNGAWSLYVMDDTYGGSGWINGGWGLNIFTIDYVDSAPDLALGITDSPDPIMIGSQVTYSINITNLGPDTATGVLVSNRLPSSLSVSSLYPTNGWTTNGFWLVYSAGTLTNGAQTNLAITATANASGTISNFVRVAASELDPNPYNNSASALTTVNPAADLAVLLAASPTNATLGELFTYALTLTNQGPSLASSFRLTNWLPATLANISILPFYGGSCTNTNNIVSCSFSNLPPNSAFTVNLRVLPTEVGPITNRARISAPVPVDLVSSNNQASLVTMVNNPSIILVPDGAVLLSESGPLNGGLDSNETVTVRFALRNIGIANTTTNLVATLQASGGITPITLNQTYGVVPGGGSSVSKEFSLTAAGPNGNAVTATLRLMDGANYLGLANYSFILGGGIGLTNLGHITIPDNGPATVYPSRIIVSNVAGVVSKTIVSLFDLNHTYPADLDLLLVAPNGQNVILMSDTGGNSDLNHIDLIFDDSAFDALPDYSPIASGLYKPTNLGTTPEAFPGPAPAGPYGTLLSALNGVNPNGAWSLYILDDSVADVGSLDGGWSLTLSTVGRLNYTSPRLSGPLLKNGKFIFTISGTPGATFLVETSTDFITWSSLGNVVLVQPDTEFTDFNPGTVQQRFYRVREP